jgi:hypothetical protein
VQQRQEDVQLELSALVMQVPHSSLSSHSPQQLQHNNICGTSNLLLLFHPPAAPSPSCCSFTLLLLLIRSPRI